MTFTDSGLPIAIEQIWNMGDIFPFLSERL